MSHILTDISSIVFLFVGLLLIFVILLQRGRGGGLAGAFGGAGGQSAFGTKAGDVFTRITIGIAIVWVMMAVLTSYAMTYESGKTRFNNPNAAETKDAAAEGALEPVAPGAAGKANPFEAGSKDNAQTPTKDAAKTTTAPPKSPPAASGKSAPAAKTAPPNSPAPTK
ncbi:MAG TPA: preprotein translocase subunit SecG [Planctomycetaceae bacterium]|jgi:preprotein translocase subunit SecG|nr:preprotein translocase subunit SecG [Planctomycetaceae bacterium]